MKKHKRTRGRRAGRTKSGARLQRGSPLRQQIEKLLTTLKKT